ncbi:MAG: lytic transglycosylase domain-containing protein [Chloroflexi bacterium]|nr:lytic transglycosylase domain-containing protein [Chloroflexota bacterium]
MPDLRAYARAAALRNGIDPDRFERQIQQESGFDPAAFNAGSGATGVAQIVPRFHPGVDPHDPLASLDYAADWMAHLIATRNGWPRALAAYNWGPMNAVDWDGRRESLPEETQHYLDVILGPGWESNTMPTMTYNPDAPVDLQPDDWSCSEQSAQWLLRSIGRNPGDAWIRDQLLSAGLVTKENGLMDASGASLAAWLQREYGDEMGLTFTNDANVDWDDLVEIAGEQPIMLGGRNWVHWTGVRYPTQEGTLALANPAPNWQAAGNELDRAEFDRLGPWSLITVSAPASSAPPVHTPSRAAVLVAEIRERLAELEGLVA